MNLNPSEISDLIKSKIQNLQLAATARTEGTVVSVTDGICRVHGLADRETGQKVCRDTLFQAGSVSKPVAAVGAMRLV